MSAHTSHENDAAYIFLAIKDWLHASGLLLEPEGGELENYGAAFRLACEAATALSLCIDWGAYDKLGLGVFPYEYLTGIYGQHLARRLCTDRGPLVCRVSEWAAEDSGLPITSDARWRLARWGRERWN